MIQVKWVDQKNLLTITQPDHYALNMQNLVEVIPLAALTEVVEELRKLRDTCRSAMVLAGLPDEFIDKKTNPADDLLAQFEDYTKGGGDERP